MLEQFPEGVSARFPVVPTYKYMFDRAVISFLRACTRGNSPSATVRDGRDLQHLETVPAPLFGTVGTFNTWKQSQRHCTGRSGPSTLGNSPSATDWDGRDLQHLETVPAPLFGTVGTFNTWKQSQRHCSGRSGPVCCAHIRERT